MTVKKKKVLKLSRNMVTIPFRGSPINPIEDGPQTPICEHCDNPLDQIRGKTCIYYTYIPEENEYMNTEKNWDYYGQIWAECPHCGKETDSVAFTEDGRLIPKEA